MSKCQSCGSEFKYLRGQNFRGTSNGMEVQYCSDTWHSEASPQPEKPPYPFDEIVDEGCAVGFNMDGDKWCANRLPFTNMMEMPVGFGDTPMQALVALIKVEAQEGVSQPSAITDTLRDTYWSDIERAGEERETNEIRREVLDIPAAGSLDSISVHWRNWEPGRGQVTILCYGSAWTAYFGGMSGDTIQEFFYRADTDYLVNKLGLTQWLKQTQRHSKYLWRIVVAVKEALKRARGEL